MSDTPETDAFFSRTDIEWDDEVDFARKLERERNEAREAFAIATSNCVDAHQRLREIEREAREAVQQ